MGPVPTITLHVPGPLRPYCAEVSQLSIEATTVRAVLEHLARYRPALYVNVCDETGTLRPHLNVFVNTTHMRELGGLAAGLAPGDEVTILPAVSGG